MSLLGSSAHAVDFMSPRLLATSGSGRAAPLLNDSIFINPAFASFLPTNTFSASWYDYTGDMNRGRNYSVSIQDGRTPMFQAGLAYTVRPDAAMVHVGASKQVVKQLGFGFGFKHLMASGNKGNAQDISLGTVAIPVDWFFVSFTADNLFESKLGRKLGMHREFALGLKANVQEIFLVYIDPLYYPMLGHDQRWGYAASLEFVIMSDLFLRMGLFRNQRLPHLAYTTDTTRGSSVGLGWILARMSIDYGFMRVFLPDLSSVHSIGLTVYL